MNPEQSVDGAVLAPSTVRIPSEKKWGIVPQPEPTCPLIDDALDDLRSALKELDGWDKCEDVGELKHKCDMGAWYADRLNVTLEKIRERAGEIRDWGDAWKTLAKDHAPMNEEYIIANVASDLSRTRSGSD
jgi:hypothetical protein